MVKCAIALMAASALAPAQEHVGSKVCSGCHRAIYDHWVKSPMGRAITPASQHVALGAAEVLSESLKRTFRVSVEAGRLVQSESGEEFQTSHPLAYAIGSGVNGFSFLVQRGDHLFQAPLSYYSRTKSWGLSPGYEFADYSFNRPIATGCIACHSGQPQPVPQRNGQFREPAFRELSIGCENCHGPGRNHAQRKGPIVNPAKLTAALSDDICMNCHQGGDTRIPLPGKTELDFRPGRPLSETIAIFKIPRTRDGADSDLLEHHESMRLSACFRSSNGRMSCRTCHNPHASAIDYRAKCVACHTRTFAAGHPDRQSDCVSCHMPKRDISVIAHSALTNHRIVRTADQPLPEAAYAKTDLVHFNPGPLPVVTRMRAYGQLMDQRPAYRERFEALLEESARVHPNDPLVLAALGRRELRAQKYEEAAALLKKALAAGSEAASTFEDLGEAQSRMGELEAAVATLRRGIELAPFAPTLRKSLALRYIKLQRYNEAQSTLAAYVELFPEDGFIRRLLTQVTSPR